MEDAPQIVLVAGALTGRHEIRNTQEDGTVSLRPADSYGAMLDAAGAHRATTAEFAEAFGDSPTGPA